MRATNFYLPLVIVVLLSLLLVDTFAAKESKKKVTSLKIRGDLNETDSTSSDANITSIDAESSVNLTEDIPLEVDIDEMEKEEEETIVAVLPKPTYLTRVKNILKRVMELLGLRKEKRKNRMMNHTKDENSVESGYHKEVRTTIGAMLGRKDCLKKAACGAGNYLRSFKGKEVILVLLEKVTPKTWTEVVRLLKESAVEDNECNYKCLDD